MMACEIGQGSLPFLELRWCRPPQHARTGFIQPKALPLSVVFEHGQLLAGILFALPFDVPRLILAGARENRPGARTLNGNRLQFGRVYRYSVLPLALSFY